MVTLYSTKVLKYKSFNRFSRFVLIGNNIDGFVDVNIVEFEHFDDVKSRLPDLVKNMDYAGEWDLKLYQIDGILEIKRLYDYYRIPRKGKLILELSYMNIGGKTEVFITDAVIHFRSFSEFYISDEKEDEIEVNLDIYEDFLTILLFDTHIKKSFVNEIIEIKNQKFLDVKVGNALNIFRY